MRTLIVMAGFISLLFASSALANPDGVVIGEGDLHITGGGNLVFSNGTIQSTAQVQGPAGNDGLNSLILLSDETAGTNCASGGVKIQTGLDLNRNGVLNDNEVTQTKYVCNGSAAPGTPGSVTGTVTYTGTQGPVNSARPIMVLINPFPNAFDSFSANGTSWQMAILNTSPGTFTFTNVPAGQYHLVAVLAHSDTFGGAIVSIGDPVEIYTPGSATGSNNHTDPATAFTVTAGQQYTTSPNISFNDSMLVGQ